MGWKNLLTVNHQGSVPVGTAPPIGSWVEGICLMLTTDPRYSAANRAAALDGVPNIRPLSRDEYPFASSLQGGAGSWIGHVPVSQQNAQGAILKNFFKQNSIKAGDQYQVIITP